MIVNLSKIIKILILTLLVRSLCSCRKVFDRTSWYPEETFPIAYTDLTINQLVTDSNYLKTDTSGLLSVAYKQKLDSLSLSVLDTFSAPPFFRNFKLESLVLEVPPFVQRFTLASIAHQLIDTRQNVLLGALILSYHGRPVSDLGPLDPTKITVPLGSIPLSLNQFFERANLIAGTLNLAISNQLPLNINNLDFYIKNASDATTIIEEHGIAINKNTSFEKVYSLAGKTVEGNLLIDIPSMDLLTDKSAIIDTNAAIEVRMTFSNLKVSSATAVFPNQDVVTDRQAVALENMGDLQLKEAIIEEGSLVMDVVSTIQDSIFMTYTMPKTTQNGIPLIFNGVVPPATATQNSVVRLEVPVKEYVFNLSTAPDYYNRFLYAFKASVKNTGRKVNLNLQDSIVINVYLKRVRPRYVRGYLGSLDTTLASSFETDIFSKINLQSFSPSQVTLRLSVENGLGVQGSVNIETLKAFNGKGESLEASDPAFIKKQFLIPPATDHPYKSTNIIYSSSSASNFSDIVSLLPTRMEYLLKAKVGGEKQDTNQFIYNTSTLKPELHIEAPLHASVQGLVLKDTLEINPAELDFETKGGTLKILTKNGFPFTATIKTTFLNPQGPTIINGIGIMEAAEVDAVSGRVIAPKEGKIELPATHEQLVTVSKSNFVVIEATFNTPRGQKVKIYSDYFANMILTAKVAPKISR